MKGVCISNAAKSSCNVFKTFPLDSQDDVKKKLHNFFLFPFFILSINFLMLNVLFVILKPFFGNVLLYFILLATKYADSIYVSVK